jgi:hypothetical protein
MIQGLRRFCIKIDPRRELKLVQQISKRGTATPDKSGTVL